MDDIVERIAAHGDLFEPVLALRQVLPVLALRQDPSATCKT
jgi:hypothetical protein